TLLAGQTNTHTSSLPGGSTLFAAQYQTGTLAVTLVDPNDQVIDPAYAASHPDIVTYAADGAMATYDFPDALAGDWDMVLAATAVPTTGSDYTTFTVFDSALKLTAETDHNWYTSGATATITAALSDSPVSAMITATILYADGVSETLNLSSQGAGQYQGAFVVPDAPGYGEVRLVATGSTATSVPFERGLNLVFQVAPDSVALTGAYSDTPLLRAPGSAFYEALSVTVGINSIVSGTVGLSAELVDADDNFVAHSFTLEDVIMGTGALALRFDGDEIYASGRNGPYTLTNLLLTDQRGATLAVLEAEDVYTTATYSYRSFGEENVYVYLPLILRNY
ncbi:MAG: hypothetical protein K8R89_07535, partial [Anaerolineae bacterium]|nr:hypothetical protein [Anaerolineae bacterium]